MITLNNLSEFPSLEEFVRKKYASPGPGDGWYDYYTKNPYESYVLKRYHCSFDTLKKLNEGEYEITKLLRVVPDCLDSKGAWSESFFQNTLVGCPIVRARRRLERYFVSAVPTGGVGVVLWEEATRWFCVFVDCVSPLGALPCFYGSVNRDDIEDTGLVYTGKEQYGAVVEPGLIFFARQMESRYVDISNLGVCFVRQVFQNSTVVYWDVGVSYTPAWFSGGRWVVDSDEISLYNFDQHSFDEARIIEQ